MKTRLDFVTNSSSSSFIMAFKDKSTVIQEATDGMPSFGKYQLELLLRDINNAKARDPKELKEIIRENLRYHIEYEVSCKHQRDKRIYSRREIKDYEETDEFKQTVERILNNKMADIEAKMKGNTVFYDLEYTDHGQADMEQNIMPMHQNTIAVINNH